MLAGSSTAEAVRTVAEHDGPWAALGTALGRRALRLPPCCAPGVEDVADNETRFVWLGRAGTPPGRPRRAGVRPLGPGRPRSCSGASARRRPGWLVGCLSEFAEREVNLTRIESRPRKQGLGRYMFFCDLEGRDTEPHVAAALDGLRGRVEVLRTLGSFPAA